MKRSRFIETPYLDRTYLHRKYFDNKYLDSIDSLSKVFINKQIFWKNEK